MSSLWKSNKGKTSYGLFFKKQLLPGLCFIKKIPFIERTSVSGSMTVEAAIVLPLFLFFFINLSSSLEMIRLYGKLEYALHRTGNEICLYGTFLEDDASSSILSQAYSLYRIRSTLGEEYLSSSPLSGGANGLIPLGSRIGTGDIVDLRISYSVSTPIKYIGIAPLAMTGRFYGHLWNGYEIEPKEESTDGEVIVYITADSEVYHTTSDCTYLKLSTRAINRDELDDSRNSGGGRYYPCEICAHGEMPDTLYICSEGNKYHYSFDCYTLKRDYSVVPLSEVEDTHRPCSRCGGS